jgi:hypothetical protein
MTELLRRFFKKSAPQVLSLNVQAALGPPQQVQRSQFSLLLRHFLERFFNHETASPDGDAKARMVLIAFATGLPGFIAALLLWPVYHPFVRTSDSPLIADPPPYWAQVDHHFVFVLYSFVALGLVTVFEWDLFFPDLLDIFVLATLPVANRRLFLARVAAIAILIVGFLFDANILAFLALPLALDPPNLSRFLLGHLLAVAASGLFSAAFILALQGVLLSLMGERLFRRISLLVQGISITVLLMLLFFLSSVSKVVPLFLQSGSRYTLWFPPFWFLGIYQRVMEGPPALPIYTTLAEIGCVATVVVVMLAALAYPFAYLRRVSRLVEGAGTHDTPNSLAHSFDRVIHGLLVRQPVSRAVFHFISQTMQRVQRYRIYLVLYGGAGLSVIAASIFQLTVVNPQVRMQVSPDGLRAAVGILAFWIIAALRMAFVSSGNQQGGWVFRIVLGRPPQFPTAMGLLLAAKRWVLLWAMIITFGALLASRAFAPPELLTRSATASQLLVAAGMCLLLTDILFLNVTTIPFTGQPAREESSLAFTLLKYLAFLPLVAWLPQISEPWIETGVPHFIVAVAAIAAVHLGLQGRHRGIIQEHCNMRELEDDEEEFPMKLGLRY